MCECFCGCIVLREEATAITAQCATLFIWVVLNRIRRENQNVRFPGRTLHCIEKKQCYLLDFSDGLMLWLICVFVDVIHIHTESGYMCFVQSVMFKISVFFGARYVNSGFPFSFRVG